MAERPGSLLHPTAGYAADRIRRDLGLSTAGRLAAVERDVASTRMTLARDLKPFRGLRLDDNSIIATPDSSGYIRLIPADGSGLVIERPQPADLHRVQFDLDVPEGCECCLEDVTLNVVIQGTTCVQGALVYAAGPPCSLTLTLDFDEACICDACEGIVVPPG